MAVWANGGLEVQIGLPIDLFDFAKSEQRTDVVGFTDLVTSNVSLLFTRQVLECVSVVCTYTKSAHDYSD